MAPTYKVEMVDFTLDLREVLIDKTNDTSSWSARSAITVELSGTNDVSSTLPTSTAGDVSSSIQAYIGAGNYMVTIYPSVGGSFVVSGDSLVQDKASTYAARQIQMRDEGKFGDYYKDKSELFQANHDALVAAYGWDSTNKTCTKNAVFADDAVMEYTEEKEFRDRSYSFAKTPNIGDISSIVVQTRRHQIAKRRLLFYLPSVSGVILYPSTGLYSTGIFTLSTEKMVCSSSKISFQGGMLVEDQVWEWFGMWGDNLYNTYQDHYFIINRPS